MTWTRNSGRVANASLNSQRSMHNAEVTPRQRLPILFAALRHSGRPAGRRPLLEHFEGLFPLQPCTISSEVVHGLLSKRLDCGERGEIKDRADAPAGCAEVTRTFSSFVAPKNRWKATR